jgi:ATP-dependent Clp protease ATP-binding subunit ClpA
MGNNFFAKANTWLIIGILFISTAVFAGEAQPNVRYKRDDITKSRFGDSSKQELLQKIYNLDQEVNKNIFGQELAVNALKSRLAQYIEGFGARTKEPIYLNMVGLPGIGKSALISQLGSLGIQTLHFDAQAYVDDNNVDFLSSLQFSMNNVDPTKPILLIIEELDKVAEIEGDKEKTQKVIGALNEILSEGKLGIRYGKRMDFSNVMVLTTMNISPVEITTFSQEALGEEKSFYDFTIENFKKFHEWILSQPSALPKILSRLFRSNTVSRLSPNTILLKPLDYADYRKVTHKTMNQVIKRMTEEKNAENKLQITFTDELLDFVTQKSAYAPSGSRNTVTKADALTEQLVHFAKRVTFNGDESLNRPRKIKLSFDKENQKAVMEVTPQVLINNKELKNEKPFTVLVDFEPNTATFIAPNDISLLAPPLINKNVVEKPLSKKQIRENRFPKNLDLTKDLNKKLNEQIFGQEEFTKMITQEMNNYLAKTENVEKTPSGVVLAGFPGIGKSELMNLTGKYLDLPIVRINLQQFSSNDNDSTNSFVSTLQAKIGELEGKKYILLLEELDKVFEVNPQTGAIVNRPVMALIKDLLNDGKIDYSSATSNGGSNEMTVDVRNAFVAVTMNFAVDRFHFEADPRLTTIEDVVSAWRRLSTRLSDLKALMGSMFLPETVNRLLARIHIMKPLEKRDYETLIEKQVSNLIKNRFHDKEGKDIGQIELQLTPAYREYLYSECVIPSEGARHTLNAVKSILNDDIELLTKKIPRNPKFSGERLIYTLDYASDTQEVKGTIAVKENSKVVAENVYQRAVSLLFPPLNAKGKMSKDRIITSIHEFGHAFVSLRLGQRFEYTTVVAPKAGVGGYVKYKGAEQTALALINSIYSSVASRAMERIILSSDASDSNSVLDITSGASNDIYQATESLFNAIHQYGFDPDGTTMERKGVYQGGVYANFSELSADEVNKLGQILREMENKIVDDLLKAHPSDWYLKKITEFARAGGLNEKEFYEMVGYAYPGDNSKSLSEKSRLHELFKGDIEEENPSVLKAKTERNSSDNKTTVERAQDYKQFFSESVRRNLHLKEKAPLVRSCSSLFAM